MSISNLPVGNIFEKISPCNVLKSAILDLKRGGYKTSELTSLKKCDMKNYAEVELITISLEIFLHFWFNISDLYSFPQRHPMNILILYL